MSHLTVDELIAIRILHRAQTGHWSSVPEVVWAQNVLREGNIYAM